jgi:anti-sigma factor RsiW
MNCDHVRPLLDALCDGELDLVRQLELEAHVRTCPGCALRATQAAARRGTLRASLPRFAAPPEFRGELRSLLRAADSPAPRTSRPFPVRRVLWNWGGVAALLAVALALGYSWGATRTRANALLDEAVSDHVRSLQGAHLMDVVSTDQHTVKPWFIGRVDFSPPVVDLAAEGFPLAGGRLDRLGGRPAAALVFRRRLHSINLFVWPAAGGAVPAHAASQFGYNASGWSKGGLDFLAVSEIPAAELDQFIQAYRARTAQSP